MKSDKNAAVLLRLGLAKKAGKTLAGAQLIWDALRAGKKPHIVIMSSEASENTKKKLRDKCAHYGANLAAAEITRQELSEAVGRKDLLSAVAVFDEGLAKLVLSSLNQ